MSTPTITGGTSKDRETKEHSSSDSVIKTIGLTKIFPSGRLPSLFQLAHHGDGRAAVYNLSLNVPRGSVYGYLGPNGAGKTTTIKMLVGLLRPTRGTASICGYTICDNRREAQRHVGYMPDMVKLPSVRALSFLETLAEYSGLNRSVAHTRAIDMLSWAGLYAPTTLDTKVDKWSAGMQRKLLFIQAMLHKPDVLILDEPTASLDPVARRSLIDLLKHVVAGDPDSSWRPTILISSHDLPEVQEVSTVIGFLNHGVLVAEGTQEFIRKAIDEATGGGAATFTVTGTRLDKIVKEVRDELGAAVLEISDTQFTVTTRRPSTFFKDLASIAGKHPDVIITNMAQEARLESIFLKLEKLSKVKKQLR